MRFWTFALSDRSCSCAALLVRAPALAVQPDEILQDPVLEARARDLSHELRCMVCQNQSIDDSDAPLAHDLRVLVRERLTKGDSDQQVLDFLVARYGDFVLLKPPLRWHTLLLWGLPPAALIAGMRALSWWRAGAEPSRGSPQPRATAGQRRPACDFGRSAKVRVPLINIDFNE